MYRARIKLSSHLGHMYHSVRPFYTYGRKRILYYSTFSCHVLFNFSFLCRNTRGRQKSRRKPARCEQDAGEDREDELRYFERGKFNWKPESYYLVRFGSLSVPAGTLWQYRLATTFSRAERRSRGWLIAGLIYLNRSTLGVGTRSLLLLSFTRV